LSDRIPTPHASLALRVALASALFGFLVLGTGMVVGYWALSRQLDARSATDLQGKRDLVVHLLSEEASAAAIPASKHRFSDILIGHHDLHLALANDATGAVLVSFSPVAAESVSVLDRSAAVGQPVRWTPGGGTALEALRGIAPAADGSRVRYYVTLDRREDSRLLRGFLRASLLGAPVLLGVIALGAWLIVRTALAPLRHFRRLAASIGTQSLHRRVSAAGLPAELGELAQDFNAMLERIDAGYRRLQEFSVDLAHELRTPIATLLGRDQVALSQPRSPEELRQVLEGDIEELERLARLIADMLFIAQAEHGLTAYKPEEVDLHAEAARVADYLAVIAEEKSVHVQVRGAARTPGARLLVQRAITNLLSNAIRHASPHSAVDVEITDETSGVALRVSNSGEPIPPQLHERIFDRFFRGDASRARLSGGTGLGLAIVRSIMKAHGGTVSAASDASTGTTTFTLKFPRRDLSGEQSGQGQK